MVLFVMLYGSKVPLGRGKDFGTDMVVKGKERYFDGIR